MTRYLRAATVYHSPAAVSNVVESRCVCNTVVAVRQVGGGEPDLGGGERRGAGSAQPAHTAPRQEPAAHAACLRARPPHTPADTVTTLKYILDTL